jgi:hypothetical protein
MRADNLGQSKRGIHRPRFALQAEALKAPAKPICELAKAIDVEVTSRNSPDSDILGEFIWRAVTGELSRESFLRAYRVCVVPLDCRAFYRLPLNCAGIGLPRFP